MKVIRNILIAEDNLADIIFTQHVLKRNNIIGTVHITRDGEEALEFLLRNPNSPLYVRPDLIIIDINLPRIGGLEVIKLIQKENNLKNIPFVILSGSLSIQDPIRSKNAGALLFIQKPLTMETLQLIEKRLNGLKFLKAS